MRSVVVRPMHLMLAFALIATSVVFTGSPSFGQANSRQGCVNQWMFNGLWRVQVTGVEPFMNGDQQTGWQVAEVWRNGTNAELSPGDSLLEDQRLELSNGAIAAKETTSGTLSLGNVANNGFAPAGQFTYKQVFLPSTFDPNNKPTAVDILFNGAQLAQFKSKPHFSSPQYNYHVNLGCTASGATAQAQGGSTQIAAREGCMNEWMSNGVWRMRATALLPRYFGPDDPKTDQVAWLVKQDWQNATSRSLLPGELPSGTTVETHVGNEYLVTKGGTNASSSNAAGNMQTLTLHVFPPGGTFTFQQLFGWSPFDKTDTPVRLLVTFDAAKQNALANHPHYTKPANFRIDLTCSK